MPLIFQQLPLNGSRCKCLPYFYACADCARCLAGDTRSLQAKPASCANAQEKPAFRKTATGIAATAFYIVAMSYCGYLITTPVFLIVIMTLMGYRRWVLTPGIALLLTAILWLLFVEALQVPLPVGTFFE
ncbi:tripartite tricarboxylate transporter TctB family protein [Escherichia coli]|nr:tripartite tricarboxylate transporter TctB family protein [Escherichia coli]